jgi:hypothetical protein
MANAVAPHLSGKNLAKLLEEALNLRRYSLFTPNAAIFEQQETARLSQQAQEDLAVESQTPDPSVAQGGPVQ